MKKNLAEFHKDKEISKRECVCVWERERELFTNCEQKVLELAWCVDWKISAWVAEKIIKIEQTWKGETKWTNTKRIKKFFLWKI